MSKKWTYIQEAWNSTVEYPSWEYEIDIKDSDRSMPNPILSQKVKGQRFYNSQGHGKIYTVFKTDEITYTMVEQRKQIF